MTKLLFPGMVAATMLILTGYADADILVGVGAPLTGPNAAMGAQIKRGVEAATTAINDAGGINGEKIDLAFGDDVSDPKQGISVANKFVADGVKIVIGHYNSGVSIPASEVYAENGILQVTPASTNPKYTERGLWTHSEPVAAMTSKGRSPEHISPIISRTPRSPSSMTRRPMARVSPMKPRKH